MKELVRRVAGDEDEQWWAEYQIDDDWMAAERLHKSENGLVAKELRIFPMQAVRTVGGRSASTRAMTFAPRQPGTADWDTCSLPKGGITARLLRLVKSQRLEAIRTWMDLMAPFADVDLRVVLGPTATTVPKKGGPRRPPRNGSPTGFYAQIAVDYAGLIDAGQNRPIREIARLRGIPPATAKRYVHRARELDFLTRSADQHGRSGGCATDNARRAVAAAQSAKVGNGPK